MEWPVYRTEMLIRGNPKSQVGIVTLFTQKERVLLYLSKEEFALLGQLYNPSYGISLLIRNCLANKNIRYLVVCGQDLSKSGEALLKLKEEGVEGVFEGRKLVGYKIKGLREERIIEKEIPLKAIELFREKVEVLDYRHLIDFNELKKVVGGLEKKEAYGEGEIFPEEEVRPERFPTDSSVFKVKGEFVGETWRKILELIMKFGVVKRSEYAEEQKEVLNLAAVVTEERSEQIKWEPYFLFSREQLEEYIPLVITNKKVEGIHYTYGGRLREWRGIDQIESIIRKLKKSAYSRRAVAVTWDVEKDGEHADAPCIDLIQCLVQDEQLFLTAFIRSNDMFEGWPRNALALRKLQGIIAGEVGVKLGSLTTISGSAHIYERDWKRALDILEKYPVAVERLNDARGNFVVGIKEEKILVEHQSPEGVILEVIEGKTAEEVSLKLAERQKVSEIYHAFYLGRELERAEIALKSSLGYEQEKPLVWDKIDKNQINKNQINKNQTLEEEQREIKKMIEDKLGEDIKRERGEKMEEEKVGGEKEGKFIVIDGLDGSGKATQAGMLMVRLKGEGYQVEMADFPQYGKWSAQFVERYLRGEFGGAREVGAKKASLFYALDRYAAGFQIRGWLEEGKIVVSNRYVSANKGHQLGKISEEKEMNSFLEWLNELEYNILGIPRPDLTLFLHMAPEIGQRLVDEKGERAYVKGKRRDIHEADLGHLKDAERAYLFCLEKDGWENWRRIICFEGEQPKTREQIHEEIYEVVKGLLAGK